MDIRNPFGLRKGKIVMIEDVPKEKRGLECDCICPSCKEPFIARIGDINRHHFAHSGKGCDEINAYLTGMYMMLNEHLSNKHPIYLPPVIVSFELSAYSYITERSIEQKTSLLSKSVDESNEVQVGKSIDQAVFDSSKIVYSSNGRPDAIIVKKGTRSMAIRITPPSTICKINTASKYKDLATLEINLSSCENLLLEKRKSEIFSYIEDNKSICNWIYNPLVKESYDKIKKRSKAYYDAAQERIKKQEEARVKALEKAITLLSLSKARQIQTNPKADEPLKTIDEAKKLEIGFNEVKDKFTQQIDPIYDQFDTRWVQCIKCERKMPASRFSIYGGDKVNLGECKECIDKEGSGYNR